MDKLFEKYLIDEKTMVKTVDEKKFYPLKNVVKKYYK